MADCTEKFVFCVQAFTDASEAASAVDTVLTRRRKDTSASDALGIDRESTCRGLLKVPAAVPVPANLHSLCEFLDSPAAAAPASSKRKADKAQNLELRRRAEILLQL